MEKTKKTYTKPELERVKFNFKAQMQSQSSENRLERQCSGDNWANCSESKEGNGCYIN